MSDNWQKVPDLITRLYVITDSLESMFGRKFTPDGHLVGSLGEAIAVYMYDLVLKDASHKVHDAETKDGKLVQIKFTAGTTGFGIYAEPDHLIALQLLNRDEVVEVFNGPGAIAWKCASVNASKNGQHSMAMGRLRALNNEVIDFDRVPKLRDFRLLQN